MKYLKLIAFILVVTSFILMSLPLFPFLSFFKSFIRKQLLSTVSVTSRMMLKVLNIKVDYKVSRKLNPDSNFLIVSNHLSYLDVIILAAKFPSCFVTSKEVQASLFLGQLSSLAGCLFVDRKYKYNLKEEILELRTALNYGLNVIVFPEATSTNGEEILRFRRPLFEAAIATQKQILPITINYQSIESQKIDRLNRDIVCWYGDMTFFDHFMKVLDQKEINVEINVSEPFFPEILSSIDLAIKSHLIVKSNYKGFSHSAMEAI
jgi:1-acyl-sn-glycerol-3-phosphate acyltransferase